MSEFLERASRLPVTEFAYPGPLRDRQHAVDEGEGLTTVAEWREVHEGFWNGAEHTVSTGGTAVLDDDTWVVLERFRVVELPPPS